MKKIIVMIIGLTYLIYAFHPSLKLELFMDSSTGLEWQNEPTKDQKKQIWSKSISYCENLDLNNKKNWRLPNIIELSSLVDDTQTNPSIIDNLKSTTLFGGANYYWSSTSFTNSLDEAWYIGFHAGNQSTSNKLELNYVRCVRSK